MAIVTELKCPYCAKTLTSAEYGQALGEFKKAAAEEYKERAEKYKRIFEDQLLDQEKKHRVEIEYSKKTHSEQIKLIQQDLKTAQDRLIEDVKKRYNELVNQREKEFSERMAQVWKSKENEIKEKERIIQSIKRNEEEFKSDAMNKQKHQ